MTTLPGMTFFAKKNNKNTLQQTVSHALKMVGIGNIKTFNDADTIWNMIKEQSKQTPRPR